MRRAHPLRVALHACMSQVVDGNKGMPLRCCQHAKDGMLKHNNVCALQDACWPTSRQSNVVSRSKRAHLLGMAHKLWCRSCDPGRQPHSATPAQNHPGTCAAICTCGSASQCTGTKLARCHGLAASSCPQPWCQHSAGLVGCRAAGESFDIQKMTPAFKSL